MKRFIAAFARWSLVMYWGFIALSLYGWWNEDHGLAHTIGLFCAMSVLPVVLVNWKRTLP